MGYKFILEKASPSTPIPNDSEKEKIFKFFKHYRYKKSI